MDVLSAIKNRHSVRKYKDCEVEQDKLDTILEAVNQAPSAGDLQAYEVVVVHEKSTRETLSAASYGQAFVAQAPVNLVFCANHLLSAGKYGKRGAELYSIQDATIAAAYSQLAAVSLGLATVWVGAFDPRAVAQAIAAPNQVTPVAIITLGYAAEDPISTPRRKLEDLVKHESF